MKNKILEAYQKSEKLDEAKGPVYQCMSLVMNPKDPKVGMYKMEIQKNKWIDVAVDELISADWKSDGRGRLWVHFNMPLKWTDSMVP